MKCECFQLWHMAGFVKIEGGNGMHESVHNGGNGGQIFMKGGRCV